MPKGNVVEQYLKDKYGEDWSVESVINSPKNQAQQQPVQQTQPASEKTGLSRIAEQVTQTPQWQKAQFGTEEGTGNQSATRERERTPFQNVVDFAVEEYKRRAEEAKEPEAKKDETKGTGNPSATEQEAPKETEKETPTWIAEAAKYMEQAKQEGRAKKQWSDPRKSLAGQTQALLEAASPRREGASQSWPEMQRQGNLQDAYRGSYLYDANTKDAQTIADELADTRERLRAAREIVNAAKEGRMDAADLQRVQAAMPQHEALVKELEEQESRLAKADALQKSRASYDYYYRAPNEDQSYKAAAQSGRAKFEADLNAETEANTARLQEEAENRTFWDYLGSGGADTTLPTGTMQYAIDAMRRGEAVPEIAQIQQTLNEFSDEQKELFYYWYEKDPDRAASYLEETKQVNAQEKLQNLRDYSVKHPVSGTLAAAGLNLLSGADYLSPLAEMAATGEVGVHQPDVTFSEMRDSLRGGISEKLNELGTIGGKGLGDLYGLGTSMLDSAIAAGTGNAVPMFFLSSAASGYQEAKNRGLDDTRALLYGTAQGIAECTFEELSIEKLLSQDLTAGFWKNVLKQAGVEASEELATSLANNISDALINGERSQWKLNYQDALGRGMSARQAYNAANKEMLTDLFYDALGGALSGGLMTAGHYAVTAPGRANAAANETNFQDADLLVPPPNTRPVQNVELEQQAQAAPVQEQAAPVEQAPVQQEAAQAQQTAPAEMQNTVPGNVQQEAAREATESAEATDEDFDFDSLAQSDPGEEGMYNNRAAGMQTEEDLTGPENVPKVSMREFADDVRTIYPTSGANRTAARQVINDLAAETVRSGTVSDEALDAAAAKLENLAQYEKQETEDDRVFRQFRQEQRGQKIYVDAQTRAELGDDWNQVRRDARNAGITLTTKQLVQDKLQTGQKVTREAEGVTDYAARIMDPESGYSSLFSGVNELDGASFLRRLTEVLGQGKATTESYTEHILGYGREMDAAHEGYRQQLRDAMNKLLENSAREQAWAEQYGGKGGGKGGSSSRTMANDTGLRNDAFTVYQAVEQGGKGNPSAAKSEQGESLPEGVGRRQVLDNTLSNSPDLSGIYNKIKDTLELDPEISTYQKIHEYESLAEANERIETDSKGEVDKLLEDDGKQWTGVNVDEAMLLFRQAGRDNAFEIAAQMAAAAAKHGTVGGQMIQAFVKWSRTPTGAAVNAVSELEKDNTISKKKKAKAEQQIIQTSQNLEDAIAEINKIKDDFEAGVYGGEMMPGTQVLTEDGQIRFGETPQSGEITPGGAMSGTYENAEGQVEIGQKPTDQTMQNAGNPNYSGEGVRQNADGQLEQLLLPAKQKIIDEIKKLARTRNTVSLFTKQISRMTEWALKNCTADECADIATAQLRAAASDLTHRTTLAEKVATIQCLAQLSSIGTVFRNLGGNAAFNVYDATSTNFGTLWDMAMSKATGKRTMTFDPGAVNKATWEGRKHGFAKAYAEVVLDADTDNVETRYGQTKGRTFKMTGNLFDRFMSTWEKASGIALNASDEYFKGGTEASYLARTQKLVDKGLLTAEEQQRLAEKEKLERTFQQDSKLARFSISMKGAANTLLGFGGSSFVKDENGHNVKDKNGKLVWMNRGRLNDAGYIQQLADRSGLTPTAIKNQMSEARFGLGNVSFNYPKIPGNLGSLLLESAPITSTINTLAKTFKVLQAGQYADAETQYEAAKAFGRSVTGYGVTAAAYLLAKAGVLMVSGVNPDEDKDRKAQREANGLSGMQINIDGLERLRKGEDPRLRNGDTLLSVDFLEPVSGLFTIGGMMAENDVDFENLAKSTLEGSANSIMDIPVMETLKSTFKDIGDYGVIGAGERLVGSGVSGFIPAPVRNLAKATDPYYRETGSAETLPGQILDSVKNNIPGLRQTLPVKTDDLGQEKTYKASDTMRWLNALVNPGNLSVYETNDVTEELEKQFQETGEGSFAKHGKNYIPNKIKVNGEDQPLSKQQQLDFKNTRGQTYFALIREMENDPAYKNATPEERNKMLDEAWTASSEAAKVAAGVGYETDNKIVGMMQDGLSLPEAYAVKQWSKDRKADQKDAGKIWAYNMGLNDGKNGLQGNEITEELERVYSSAGDGKLPTGEIPDHLTVDGEEVELTEEQQAQYKQNRAEVYNGIVGDLLASDRYKNADAEDQLAMLEEAYKAAGEAAKVNLETGYESDSKIYKLLQSGLGVADAYAAKEMHNEIDEKKKSDGKGLGMNAKAAQFKSWVESQGWTKAQQNAVLDKYGTYSSMTFSDTEKYDKLTAAGVNSSKASKLITDLNKLMPQNGKEDVTDLQRMKLIANDKSLSADQKILAAYLYAGNSKTSLDKFLDSGLGIAEYVDAKEAIQKYGHQTSSGTWSWKKDELIKYLNSTDYTNQQKFWVMKTFWTGKDKNNPWYRYAGDPAEHREPDGSGGGETEDGGTGGNDALGMTADEAWKYLNGG